jgi:hypothetical protein
MMTSKKSVRFTKPSLEVLEGRSLPSFLMSGAVNQLAQPMNNMVADLNAARTALTTAQTALLFEQLPVSTPPTIVAQNFAHGAAAYQRMLNDVHLIAATSTADLAFIKAAAVAELMQGDPMDFLVVNLGPAFGIDVTTPLTTPVDQANTTLQSVQSIVNQTYFNVGLTGQKFNLPSMASQTTAPSF